MTFRKDFKSSVEVREAGANLILKTDSYKLTHWKIYPPNTTQVYSYGEARSSGIFNEYVFFGLQYILDKHLAGVVVNDADIDRAEEFCKAHFGQDLFNREGWEYIVKEHGGKLPLVIKAVPEGSVVEESNVLFTITNTDPNCAWLVNAVETLLVQMWYPIMVATGSRENKKVLKASLEKSSDTMDTLPFMLHDFGYRGSTSVESAAIGGASHLVNFMGSDTIAAIEMLKYHYDEDMAAFSVPAAEHSTITAWGRDREVDAYRHILNQYNSGLVSVVSDSWDVFKACSDLWGGELKDEVISDDRVLVVRPDSGDPHLIVPACLNLLGKAFGFTYNSKGYKVLPDYIRVIQGDGITPESLPTILDAIMEEKWATSNVVFGSGGGLLQKGIDRDGAGFAVKCSHVVENGVERDVYKEPATSPAKNSKRGKLKLSFDSGDPYAQYITIPSSNPYYDDVEDVMQEVFRDGEVLNRTTLAEVRQRAELDKGEGIA